MAPGTPIIDLFADAPMGNPKASAYLLAAYAPWFPAGAIFLCVVDPGVGGTRPPLILEADGRWYVGPGNGLFELVQRRAGAVRCWDIDWMPEHVSASFHGRDIFAPVAARLARGETPTGRRREADADRRADWPDDLPEVVYVDHFGNAMTGLRAATLPAGRGLSPGIRCWSVQGPSAIGRRARLSGTRTLTDWPRSRSTWDARTATSVSRSGLRSRSSAKGGASRSDGWHVIARPAEGIAGGAVR